MVCRKSISKSNSASIHLVIVNGDSITLDVMTKHLAIYFIDIYFTRLLWIFTFDLCKLIGEYLN